jgi:hypothetical protein
LSTAGVAKAVVSSSIMLLTSHSTPLYWPIQTGILLLESVKALLRQWSNIIVKLQRLCEPGLISLGIAPYYMHGQLYETFLSFCCKTF